MELICYYIICLGLNQEFYSDLMNIIYFNNIHFDKLIWLSTWGNLVIYLISFLASWVFVVFAL